MSAASVALPPRSASTPSSPVHLDTPNETLFGERLGLASGVIFGLAQVAATVFFIATLAPHMPPVSAPGADHARFYTEFRHGLELANYLFLVPFPFFLLFLGGLFTALRRAEGQIGALTVASTLSGLAMAVIVATGAAVAHSGQMTAVRGLDGETVFAFDSVAQISIALSAFPRAILLAGSALLLLRAGMVPRWLGWSGLVLGAIAFASTAGFLSAALFPLVALGYLVPQLWIAAVGVTLLRRA